MRTAIPSHPAMEDVTDTKDFEPKRALYPPSDRLPRGPSDYLTSSSMRSIAAPGHRAARERSVAAPRLECAIAARKVFGAPKFAVRLLVAILPAETISGAIHG